jgi:transposase-like protein
LWKGFWIVRTGSPWRDLPAAFGEWNSVFRRFSRWTAKGVWARIFAAMSDDPDFEYLRGCQVFCVSVSRGTLYLVEGITDHGTGDQGRGHCGAVQGYSSPQDLLGEEGLFKELRKRLLERALGAELSEHLGYEKGDAAGRGSGNNRNGYSAKTVLGDDGAIELAVPRDRQGSFEPQIVPKGQTRLEGFDDRIVSLYARGLSVREIQGHLQELYGVEVSPDLISRVTDAVLEDVRAWQNRPLDPVYPVIFFDALRVKIRDEGLVRNKAVYVALALNNEGEKEVPGLWIEQTEGAKFWLKVMNELKTRGVNDVLIAVVDGLKGFVGDSCRRRVKFESCDFPFEIKSERL